MRFNDILLEYNRDQTVKNYGPKILAIAVKDRSVPWIDIFGGDQNPPVKVQQVLQTPEGQQAAISYIMEVIENSDPTKNKNYAQAITRLYSLGGTMLEDIGATLSQYLVKFDKLKNKKKIPAPHNDFMRYKSISEFYDVVDQLPDPDSDIEQQKISAVQLPPHDTWRYVYGSLDEQGRITSDCLIIQPLDQYAAYWWAKEYPKKGVTNRWCTAWEGDNSRFSYYNRQGPLYIIIPAKRNDDNEKYQFHFETKQFMDFQDHQLGDDGIASLSHRLPGLQKVFAAQASKYSILGLMSDEYKAAVRSHSKVASQELNNLIEQYKERIAGFGFNSLGDYGIDIPDETKRDLMPLIEKYLDQCRGALLSKDGFWKQVVSRLGTERNEDRLEVILNTDSSLKAAVEQSEAGQAVAQLAQQHNISQRIDVGHLQDLLLRDPLFRFTMRQVPKLYAPLIAELTPVNEGYDMDQVRRDAEASLKANIDKQSNARIDALRNPPKEKSFLQKVGDKQIGMVKGAVKGAINGFRGVAEQDLSEVSADTLNSYLTKVDAKKEQGGAEGSESECPRCRSTDIKTYSDGEKECHHCHKTWDVQGVAEGEINGPRFSSREEAVRYLFNKQKEERAQRRKEREEKKEKQKQQGVAEGSSPENISKYAEELVAKKGRKEALKHALMMANLGRDPSWLSVIRYIESMKGVAEENEYGDLGDDDGVADDGFFVVIANENDGAFVGMVTKDGGRWRESDIAGEAPAKWGSAYMSYLTPDDVMQHIRNDYSRHSQVKGPFYAEDQAMDYARNHFDLGADDDYYDEDDLDEGRMKDIDIGRQDRDAMNPQQFRGQYKQSKDEWTADNKGVLDGPTPAATPRKKAANTVEAYMEVYNKRDQREFKSMPFPNEKAAQRWADAHNAIIHSIVPLRGVSEQVDDEEPEDEVEYDDNKVAGRYHPDEFDELVNRVKAKAKEQERRHGPVDIAKLAARLNSIK